MRSTMCGGFHLVETNIRQQVNEDLNLGSSASDKRLSDAVTTLQQQINDLRTMAGNVEKIAMETALKVKAAEENGDQRTFASVASKAVLNAHSSERSRNELPETTNGVEVLPEAPIDCQRLGR